MADGGGVIDNLTIQNFRLFESLEVKGIKRVNLIVGRNNAGKSALLEAFQLYFSAFSPFVIYQILTERQELLVQKMDGFEPSPLRHLFFNHKMPMPIKDKENLLISSSNVKLTVGVNLFDSYLLIQYNKLDDNTLINEEWPINNFNEFINSMESIVLIKKRPKYTQNIRKLSTKGLTDDRASSLWDSISLTSAQDDVIKAFHIIEPKITGLSFVAADNESNDRLPIIKLSDMPEPIPLKSLGDGMTRLFHIILSLVTAKDGVLLIDEFENGLHWSTQTKAWELIFILAKQWNVQVFCTTHSKDCINGFEDVWTQNPEEAAFFRLYRKENQSHIKAYDLEMLSDAIETETEVR